METNAYNNQQLNNYIKTASIIQWFYFTSTLYYSCLLLIRLMYCCQGLCLHYCQLWLNLDTNQNNI